MMKLSLSCRIAEGFLSKEEPSMTLDELASVAIEAGYDALCMRASQVGVESSSEQVAQAAETLQARKLPVTMVTGDFDIVYNNDRGPRCLRNISPYLDLAAQLGAPMIRVCVKGEHDIRAAQAAADEAAERGTRLVHQCHTLSAFETIEGIVETLNRIDRPNFGLIFEAANLELCGQNYGPSAIERLRPWLWNVYVQNQRLSDTGSVTLDTWERGPVSFDVAPIPEPGGVDFDPVFEGLCRIGYDGPITVHQSAPEDIQTTPLAAAQESAAFLRRQRRGA